MRGQSFAGHALADVGAAGGSGAFLIGVSPLWGFVGIGIAAAGCMELIGIRRPRGRDLATGIVLGAGLGLAALFLYWDTTFHNTTGATINILFGSMFAISSSTVPLIVVFSIVAIGVVVVLYRPLVLSSVSPDLASGPRCPGTSRRDPLPPGPSRGRVVVGGHHRCHSQHGVVDRPSGRGIAPYPHAWVGGGRGRAHRGGGHLARCALGLRQLLLAAPEARLAGQFFRGGADLRLLSRSAAAQSGPAPGSGSAAEPVPDGGRDRDCGRDRGVAVFTPLMVNTWVAATIVAVVAGVVGYFTVFRGSAFVAHAVPQSAFAGAAGASLLGINTIAGLGVFSLLGALSIGALGRRSRHDVATALAVVMMLGLGALFLSFSQGYEPAIYSLLFGEVLGVSRGELWPIGALGAGCIGAILVVYRPLMLSSVIPEVGEARGIRSHYMEMCFLVVVAAATSMAVPVVGALLIFSLLIGPPAAARSFARRPLVAMALSSVIAVATVWASIVASYLSNLPIGFFVGTIGAAAYGLGRAWSGWSETRAVAAIEARQDRDPAARSQGGVSR